MDEDERVPRLRTGKKSTFRRVLSFLLLIAGLVTAGGTWYRRPWALHRIPQGTEVKIATHVPAAVYPDEILALRQELEQMVARDQSTRNALDHRRAEAEDLKNAAAVLRIFNRYGWVGRSLAGKDAAHNFWLLVQHQTPDIQRKLLPFLEHSALTGESSMSDYAYLYDRVQVGLGKPQRWGTQAVCESGKPVLAPVEEPQTLEERRARLYLPPVSTYLAMDYLVRFCSQSPE